MPCSCFSRRAVDVVEDATVPKRQVATDNSGIDSKESVRVTDTARSSVLKTIRNKFPATRSSKVAPLGNVSYDAFITSTSNSHETEQTGCCGRKSKTKKKQKKASQVDKLKKSSTANPGSGQSVASAPAALQSNEPEVKKLSKLKKLKKAILGNTASAAPVSCTNVQSNEKCKSLPCTRAYLSNMEKHIQHTPQMQEAPLSRSTLSTVEIESSTEPQQQSMNVNEMGGYDLPKPWKVRKRDQDPKPTNAQPNTLDRKLDGSKKAQKEKNDVKEIDNSNEDQELNSNGKEINGFILPTPWKVKKSNNSPQSPLCVMPHSITVRQKYTGKEIETPVGRFILPTPWKPVEKFSTYPEIAPKSAERNPGFESDRIVYTDYEYGQWGLPINKIFIHKSTSSSRQRDMVNKIIYRKSYSMDDLAKVYEALFASDSSISVCDELRKITFRFDEDTIMSTVRPFKLIWKAKSCTDIVNTVFNPLFYIECDDSVDTSYRNNAFLFNRADSSSQGASQFYYGSNSDIHCSDSCIGCFDPEEFGTKNLKDAFMPNVRKGSLEDQGTTSSGIPDYMSQYFNKTFELCETPQTSRAELEVSTYGSVISSSSSEGSKTASVESLDIQSSNEEEQQQPEVLTIADKEGTSNNKSHLILVDEMEAEDRITTIDQDKEVEDVNTSNQRLFEVANVQKEAQIRQSVDMSAMTVVDISDDENEDSYNDANNPSDVCSDAFHKDPNEPWPISSLEKTISGHSQSSKLLKIDEELEKTCEAENSVGNSDTTQMKANTSVNESEIDNISVQNPGIRINESVNHTFQQTGNNEQNLISKAHINSRSEFSSNLIQIGEDE